MALSSSSTPSPKAAARAPPPDSVTAAITDGEPGGAPTASIGLRAGVDSTCSDGASGWLSQGRVVEQAASSTRAMSSAKRCVACSAAFITGPNCLWISVPMKVSHSCRR